MLKPGFFTNDVVLQPYRTMAIRTAPQVVSPELNLFCRNVTIVSVECQILLYPQYAYLEYGYDSFLFHTDEPVRSPPDMLFYDSTTWLHEMRKCPEPFCWYFRYTLYAFLTSFLIKRDN